MRGIVSTRRRADEFEAGVESGTVSSSAPAETRVLVGLVQQIRAIDTVQTRADFTAALRTRLMAAAPAYLTVDETVRATAPTYVDDRRTTPARRALSAAAAACIVVGGGVGVAAASQTALPGESLYPVKRGIEHLEVSTAGSSAGRGQEYLQQADNRLTEIEQLALTQPDDYATPLLMRRALDDFSAAARDGGDSLMTAYRDDGSDQSISDLRQFTGESSRRLEAMMPILPGDLHDELVAAAESLSTLDSTARQLCPMCSTLGPLELSSAWTIVREPLGQVTREPDVSPVPSPLVGTWGHNKPHAPVSPSPGQRGPDLPVATTDPNPTAAVLPSQAPPSPSQVPPSPSQAPPSPSQAPPSPSEAPPSAPVRSTTPLATAPNTAGATPDVTPQLPRPPAGSNNQPRPSIPVVDVEDPLGTVPEVLDTTGDVLDPVTGGLVDPLLP